MGKQGISATSSRGQGVYAMNSNVYRWNLRPEAGLVIELRVTAESVLVARREVRRFLSEHDGDMWVVEGVAREASHAPHLLVGMSRPPQVMSV